MRNEYYVVQIFYHKKPRAGHCLELEFNDKPKAIREALSYRNLGFTTKMYKATDMPLFFHDPRDEEIEEKQVVIIPAKRGRKAKYS